MIQIGQAEVGQSETECKLCQRNNLIRCMFNYSNDTGMKTTGGKKSD